MIESVSTSQSQLQVGPSRIIYFRTTSHYDIGVTSHECTGGTHSARVLEDPKKVSEIQGNRGKTLATQSVDPQDAALVASTIPDGSQRMEFIVGFSKIAGVIKAGFFGKEKKMSIDDRVKILDFQLQLVREVNEILHPRA